MSTPHIHALDWIACQNPLPHARSSFTNSACRLPSLSASRDSQASNLCLTTAASSSEMTCLVLRLWTLVVSPSHSLLTSRSCVKDQFSCSVFNQASRRIGNSIGLQCFMSGRISCTQILWMSSVTSTFVRSQSLGLCFFTSSTSGPAGGSVTFPDCAAKLFLASASSARSLAFSGSSSTAAACDEPLLSAAISALIFAFSAAFSLLARSAFKAASSLDNFANSGSSSSSTSPPTFSVWSSWDLQNLANCFKVALASVSSSCSLVISRS
mmetsp:Transcript_41986/g.75410  ORF Transcript_41986/g.75410 Transcript_41986/m.75410 type:complete len:268 (-) Transcript_41986:287-1090(-)